MLELTMPHILGVAFTLFIRLLMILTRRFLSAGKRNKFKETVPKA